MTPLAVLLGVGVAVGALVALDGFRPSSRPPAAGQRWGISIDRRRVGFTVAAVIVTVVVTRWPVAGVAVTLFVWFAPQLLGGRATRAIAMARTEAIASWTEMLRDTISAAHGIEAAIAATAPLSPPPIRFEVRQLARRLEHEPLPVALAELAGDLAHPIGDLVVAALAAAATQSTRDLADLLSTLAAAARDEATMQLRVEAARARMRTAVRVISAVTLTTATALIVLNPTYVDVYGTAAGQIVLAFIFGCWGTALWWLAKMSRFESPQRFLITRTERMAPR